MMYLDLNTFTPSLNLNYTDKMSSAASVEVRVPFLDHRLIEKAYTFPDKFFIKNFHQKYILKKIAQRELPKEIIWRKKAGFGAPVGSWINNSMKSIVLDYLSEESINRRGIFNSSFVQKLLKDNFEGRAYNANQIWQLLNFEIWYRNFLNNILSKFIYYYIYQILKLVQTYSHNCLS